MPFTQYTFHLKVAYIRKGFVYYPVGFSEEPKNSSIFQNAVSFFAATLIFGNWNDLSACREERKKNEEMRRGIKILLSLPSAIPNCGSSI
jgi:hypothetical protein